MAKRIINRDDEPEYKWNETLRERIWKDLCKMKHRDLQRACIVRGLEPEFVIQKDHSSLVVWFYENYNNTEDENLLIIYDNFIENELRKKGYTDDSPFLNPCLRFSYVKPLESDSDLVKPKKEKETKEEKEAKPKREMTDWGISSGTKKFLTYQCCIQDGLNMPATVIKVKESYPEAEEKSIKIWYKRALELKK